MSTALRPPTGGTELAITFLYYRDLAQAMRFYEEVMGFELAIDQGWSKIYRIVESAHLGLVDEARGMNKWRAKKPVQICIRVPDVAAWHAYARARELPGLSELFQNDQLGIRAFVFEDPEGYQIEVQSATRPGARMLAAGGSACIVAGEQKRGGQHGRADGDRPPAGRAQDDAYPRQGDADRSVPAADARDLDADGL